MTGGQVMVVLIVAIVMIASIIRAKYTGGRSPGSDFPENSGEARRLREEVKELNERIKVLERIAVEKENSLAKQIEELRDS